MPATPAWPPKSMPRLFVGTPLAAGASIELDAGQANYLGNVMRLGIGEHVLLFDGASGEWIARIAEAGRKRMTLAVEDRTREQETVPDCWLAFAPLERFGPWLRRVKASRRERARGRAARHPVPVLRHQAVDGSE